MERFKMFLLGVLVAICFFLLIGARGGSDIGRYQIEVIGQLPTSFHVIIVDTSTGMVKSVAHSKDHDFDSIEGQWRKNFEDMQ